MKQWYKNRKKDHFYLKAKKNDVISRAYYKIEEIDKRFRIVKKNSRVLDIGCCPGGWVQYVLNQKGSQTVVGIDILEMENQFDENFVFYNYDLNEYENIRKEFSIFCTVSISFNARMLIKGLVIENTLQIEFLFARVSD